MKCLSRLPVSLYIHSVGGRAALIPIKSAQWCFRDASFTVGLLFLSLLFQQSVTTVMDIHNITLQIKIIELLPRLWEEGMGSIERSNSTGLISHLNPLRSGFCVQWLMCTLCIYTHVNWLCSRPGFYHLSPVHCYESWSLVFRRQKSLTSQLWKYLDHQLSWLTSSLAPGLLEGG